MCGVWYDFHKDYTAKSPVRSRTGEDSFHKIQEEELIEELKESEDLSEELDMTI